MSTKGSVTSSTRGEREIDMTKPKRRKQATLTALVGSVIALQILGRTSGSTRAERRSTMPGDHIVPRPNLSTTHATTIAAPPECVWPWLIQMGWHQGGFYTSPLIDRVLFPVNAPSVDYVIPELQTREVGDFIPDGPPEAECGYTIAGLEYQRSLVLHSQSHLPLAWRQRLGARLDWTWDFQLAPVDAGTRLIFRARGVTGPWWVWALYQLVVVPADYIMGTQMMRGVARRAERLAANSPMAVP